MVLRCSWLLQITDELSSVVVAQLLFLQSESNKKPIHMYINSPGLNDIANHHNSLFNTYSDLYYVIEIAMFAHFVMFTVFQKCPVKKPFEYPCLILINMVY